MRTLFSLLTGVMLITCAPAHAQDYTLLDFEKRNPKTGLPEGWTKGIGRGNSGVQDSAQCFADSVIKHDGRYALFTGFRSENDFASAVFKINKTFNAHMIRLTGWLKTEDVKGWAGLWMRIDGKDHHAIAFDNMQDQPVTGTTDWKQYTIELEYNKQEAMAICIGSLLVGSGKIWIDNFRLTLDDKDIAAAEVYMPDVLPADIDTAFKNGSSSITAIAVTPQRIKDLSNLGALWGFIKYYHAGVQEGKYNMDASLFRVLPQVLAAQNSSEAAAVMERWVDGFGVPPPCASCKDITKEKDVMLKPDYHALFQKGNLSPSLIAKLDNIRRNRYSGEGPHYYIRMNEGVGNPDFRNEAPYEDRLYPDAGVRLLALYRFWNMIQYFFPYRHLISEDWNGALAQAIPEFCNAADTAAYQLACLKLIARISDTHAGMWGGGSKLEDVKGRLITPFIAEFIEGRLVVTGYYKDTPEVSSKLKRGDIIERIDGVAVSALVKKYLPLTPASNYETQLRNMSSMAGFLLRSNKKTAELHVSRDGVASDIKVARIPVDMNMRLKKGGRNPSETGHKILAGNIGYLFPSRLTNASFDSVKTAFRDTKGIIIDLRCYPGTFMPFTYGAWLKPSPSPFVQFTTGSVDMPGTFTKTSLLENGEKNSDYYKGKVIIIVNESTMSQAEYTTLAFQTIPGAVVIGSTTAGADGNVSAITLPGGIGTMISGINVLYPDGTETQRKGVKIDHVIKPTIKGIQAGRDELLEAALKMIKG